MGKRIVYLEMETEDAEAFVRLVDGISEVSSFERESGEELHFPAQVQAVVAKPTTWCKCAVEASTGRRRRSARKERGWSRGSTFGWWLCVHCHKPSRPIVMHFITNLLGGNNDLLPKILGTGPAVPPTTRWREEGGTPNTHANTVPSNPTAEAGTSRRAQRIATGKVKPKVRPRRTSRGAELPGGIGPFLSRLPLLSSSYSLSLRYFHVGEAVAEKRNGSV